MSKPLRILALDIGERRIGVAQGDTSVKIAVPYDTIERDGGEVAAIARLVIDGGIDQIVVGYPRNQSGEATQQTEAVEAFARQLEDIDATIVFQDESLTSVLAEDHLKRAGKPYQPGDIDALAASIILEDYLESIG